MTGGATGRLALLGALAGLLAACAGSGGEEDARVVVLVEVDTLRADALGCYGNDAVGEKGIRPSPNIDQFAAESVLFERAYSAAPWTIPSLTTQLTGRWPWDHGALRLIEPIGNRLVTLAERFRASGWRTAGVTTNFVARQRYGFAQGFELWDEQFATGHRGSYAHEAVDVLLELSDELTKRPQEGIFLFLLLFEPHYHYEEQPGLRFGPRRAPRLTGAEGMKSLRRMRSELGDADVRFLRGRYQGEVARADAAFGELVQGLEARGMMDHAVVAFTADHGEEIMDRGWIGHALTLHEELVRVPLVVRLPGGAGGRRIERPVSQIDLGATLLELAGIEGGLGDGLSFARTLLSDTPSKRRYLYLHTDFEPPLDQQETQEKRAHQWGVVDAETRRKWVVNHLRAAGPEGRLYDIDSDRVLDEAPAPELVRMVALDPDRADPRALSLSVEDEGTP